MSILIPHDIVPYLFAGWGLLVSIVAYLIHRRK